MPSHKTRSKEDTWTTRELERELKQTGERRRTKDRDEERKQERLTDEDRQKRSKHDDSAGSRHGRSRDVDEDVGDVHLNEEERERQREERRKRKEGKTSGKDKTKKELTFRAEADNKTMEFQDAIDESDPRHYRHEGRERRHHDKGSMDKERDRNHKNGDNDEKDRPPKHRNDNEDREKRRKSHDEDDLEARRRHKDDDREKRRRIPDEEDQDGGRHRHKEDDDHEKRRKTHDEDDLHERRRHKDDNDREQRKKAKGANDEDDRERRRMERRMEKEQMEEEERRRRHEEKKRRNEEDENGKRKGRDDRSDKHRDRKDKEKGSENEREKEEKREKEREERRKERDKGHHKGKDDNKQQNSKETEKRKEEEYQAEDADDYNYEEDFEEYQEDFEEDEDEDVEVIPNISRKKHDSEINDVLRAVNAENEKFFRESSRSPQVSSDYGSRKVKGNRDLESDEENQQAYQPQTNRHHTMINFVSAKQRAVNRKTASKTMQRGNDLLKMLELDFASFDMLDLPPVNEYDLYIRAFGSSDTRQAYVQTNDDNIDRDIQSEEIDVRQKWTQHPPEDFKGYGRGDGEKDVEDEEESLVKQHTEHDVGKLNTFLEKACQVIAMLLEEGKDEEEGAKGRSQTHINVSEGYTELELLNILKGRYVVYSYFSPVQTNLLLTVYSPDVQMSAENHVSKRGVICVWNTNEPNYPQKILVCSSQPRCACFSPVKPYLVFAGMTDGSIAMWDLREATSIHQPVVINGEVYSIRYPTYDTAGVLNEENHHSPIACILPIYTYTDSSKSDVVAAEESSSGLSFQLVTTEEISILHFWVVAEILPPDMSGSPNDFGLAPGGTVKLLKSSSLVLENPLKDNRHQSGLRSLDMSLMPSDPNHVYVGTDSGFVVHAIRFGKQTFPRVFTPVIESVVDVVSIDFSPFDQPCFLAGCSDGTFSLYHTKSEYPLNTWLTVTKGRSIQCVRWSRSRPCVFYVLDINSTLYVFDLLEGDGQPKYTETLSQDRVTSLEFTSDLRQDFGTHAKETQMTFSTVSGKTEIHTINKLLRQPEQLEMEFLQSYLQKF